ncbi:beta strand repeat-containing protein [Paracoccus binzhouensis]|uniref:beta strand repeat-containing protein n=1 Tax=Paracoccus binzhouensis TaxID=2796149 RepID=UPI0018EF0E29|nr:calcium-binding protein [Paracoccus binzhouensis]
MATINGTDGSDTLVGTGDADVINALGGNDSLTGGGGNDTMRGGSGDDTFYIGGTEFGRDVFDGGDGADRIRLSGDVTVSSLLLNSSYLTSTETLDFSIYDIRGTGGNDVFDISGVTYTVSYDWIYLYDGNDSFVGYAGSDEVDGGSGADTLNGGAGSDYLTGGGGNDRLIGGSGDDTFYIGGTDFGHDVYDGGEGADRIRLTGDVTVASLQLTSANVISTETLDFSIYDIQGTGGNDVFNISGITYTVSYDWIYLSDGNDSFVGYAGSDEVDGGSGADTLNGGAGSDYLTGGGGNDRLIGGSGDDTFYIGGTDFGHDVYDGGEGADRIRMTGDITVSRLQLTSANVIGTETLDFAIYDIQGTGGNDVFNISGITYTVSYDWIYLHDGNDSFVGYSGSDEVDGGAGADTLNGGAGNDYLTGGTGNDRLIGGTGDDIFYISGTDFGQDVYDGGAGADRIRLTGDVTVARLALTAANVIGTETLDFSIYDIAGTGGNDVFNISGIRQTVSYDTIYLQDGNDIFVGYAGSDYVDAGAGSDTLFGEAGNDELDGGAGIDLVGYGAARGGVRVNLSLTSAQVIGGGQGTDTLANIENVNGSRFADAITGSAAANVLNGAAGNDVLAGLLGHDRLSGGIGNDLLNGGTGNDRLDGGAGYDTAGYGNATGGVRVDLRLTTAQAIGGGQGSDLLLGIEALNGSNYGDRLIGNGLNNRLNGGNGHDRLDGLVGNDLLQGGAGSDTLFGGVGNDVVTGGAGNDFMAGGLGADAFVFAVGNGADRITDWQDGLDRIRIVSGNWQGQRYDSFDDLDISQSGGNAVVRFGGTSITLNGVQAGELNASDFVFV